VLFSDMRFTRPEKNIYSDQAGNEGERSSLDPVYLVNSPFISVSNKDSIGYTRRRLVDSVALSPHE
jgi:hypothetical protein